MFLTRTQVDSFARSKVFVIVAWRKAAIVENGTGPLQKPVRFTSAEYELSQDGVALLLGNVKQFGQVDELSMLNTCQCTRG